MKILICGLPGSGKSTLGEPLAKMLGGVWINADKVREQYDDWDFSMMGRHRQANRMKYLADGVEMAGKIAIADFVAPTKKARKDFDADYVVWMDTIKEGRFEDTNRIFEPPEKVDYHVSEWFDDTDEQLFKVLKDYMEKNDV